MTQWRDHWRNLNRRQKTMIAVAALLIVLVAGKYIDFSSALIPLPRTLEKQEQELRIRQSRLAKLEKRRDIQDGAFIRFRHDADQILWRVSGKVPSTEIQTELEKAARAATVTIRTMGSPRTRSVSEHLQSVEITVNLVGTIRDLSRFLAEVEKAKHRLTWLTCSIRTTPVPGAASASINLTGRLQALYLAPELEQLIFANETGS